MVGKANSFTVSVVLLFLSTMALAQTGPIRLRGMVLDDSTSAPVAGVLIRAKGSFMGAYSDDAGKFLLRINRRIPLVLSVEKTGFLDQDITVGDTSLLAVRLVPDPKIVSAPSRQKKRLSESLISADKMDYREIQQSPALNFYPALGNLRGAYLNTPGMLVQSVGPIGLSSGANRRTLQLVDGIDTQVPGEGYNLGNFYGIPELDVESAEWAPINSSPIYGPNSMNGVLSMNSKSPFDFPGLSAIGKVGMANIGGDSGEELIPLYEYGLRYGLAFRNRVAVKFNYSQIDGEDWQSSSRQNVRPGSLPASSRGTDPGYDGANVYGDEIFSVLPFASGGGDQVVTRTGYEEQDLGQYDLNNRKIGASLHLRPLPALEAILHYQSSSGNSVFQEENRSILNDIESEIFKIEIKGSHFFLRAYQSSLDIGTNYDMVLLGQGLNLAAKNNTEWFRDYSSVFQQPPFDQSTHREGRVFADGLGINPFGNNVPWLEPGTPIFEITRERLIDGEIPFLNMVGAQFESVNQLRHFEGYYDFTEWISFIDVQVGYMIRYQDLNRESSLINDLFQIESFNQLGTYAQIGKSLLEDQLDLQVTLRFDDNNLYPGRWSTRLAAGYRFRQDHHFRASFQQGFRDPSLQELLLVKPNGEGELRGGLNNLNATNLQQSGGSAVPLVGFSIYEAFVRSFSQAVEAQVAQGISRSVAEQNNLQILDDGILTNDNGLRQPQPEENQTFELGYRTRLTNGFQADVSYFHNTLDRALGQTTVFRPFGTQPPGFDLAAAATLVADPRTRQKITYYQNARRTITSQGIMVGLNYGLPKKFRVGMNGTWIKFNQDDFDVVRVHFNAPEFKANFFLANPEIIKNLGFQFIWRWQDGFNWRSVEQEGSIGSYAVLDGQVNYRIPKLRALVKLGGTNLINSKYQSMLGGAQLGGLYYLSLGFYDINWF